MADPLTILHIEDNPDNRRLVRRLLIGDGYRVIEAEDGLAGIELAIRERPDLILLDVNIPRFDGYETAMAMRAFPALQSALIVALTAHTDQNDRLRILTAGCDGYIGKPIDVDRFCEQVTEFLRGRREQAEPSEQNRYLHELNQALVQRLLTKIQELAETNDTLTSRTSQLETLHRIGELITSQLSIQALAEVLPGLARSLGFAEIELGLLNGDTGEVLVWPRPADGDPTGNGAPADGLIEVPLAIQGRAQGKIRARLASPAMRRDDAEHVLRTVASQVAVAAENARLYDGLRRQMEELRAAEAQLVQSGKLAAVGELVANVAHEINNPMTSILGYATLLYEETPPASPRKATLKLIQDESLRIREIVRALLDFSRQQASAKELVDIRQVLRDTIALVHRHASLSNIVIEEPPGETLPLVAVDVAQCKQVFLNLITNALDAMPNGGTLTLRLRASDDMITIEVSDTGVGIPPENLGRIFEPFFTTKPAVKGTGLGLSVSLGIIQSHGGSIAVTSEPGRGSCFMVSLPRKQP